MEHVNTGTEVAVMRKGVRDTFRKRIFRRRKIENAYGLREKLK